MNAFYAHHKDSIRFGYRCFDRILVNGLIQPFQQPERVVGFFGSYRQLYPVSRDVLRNAAEQFQAWVKGQAEKWNAPIVEAPKGRRDEFVEPYFRNAEPDQVVVVVKAREPARIMTAIGDKKVNRWHLQIAERWVMQYNFYVNDRRWGRMFVRMCPYVWTGCRSQVRWCCRKSLICIRPGDRLAGRGLDGSTHAPLISLPARLPGSRLGHQIQGESINPFHATPQSRTRFSWRPRSPLPQAGYRTLSRCAGRSRQFGRACSPARRRVCSCAIAEMPF